MASGNYDIRPATALPAPPATDEPRHSPWLPALPPDAGKAAPPSQPPAPASPQPPSPPASSAPAAVSRPSGSALRVWLRRLWGARGLFGGLLAIGIAWLGQNALITQNDYVTSTRNYVIAIVLLILSLLHPSAPSFLKRKKSAGSTEAVESSLSPSTQEMIVPGLTVRQARSKAATISGNGKSAEHVPAAQASPKVAGKRANLWERYKALRARLGWRMTAPGLALTLALALASLLALNGDPASRLGGWLWAGALAVLLLTFLGAPGWPRGQGLLPDAWSDWFAPGVPRIPWKVEAALVLLLIGLATFLRVWNLEYHPGIFGDEGERGLDARAIFEGRPDNLFSYGWWGVPNIYFYLLAATYHVFGDNLVGDRMLSAISGIVAVWYVYKIGRLLWGPRAGLIAGAMMAVSPLALQFSRLAGESTPTGALWAVGAYYLLLALRHRRWSDWVLSGFFWSFNLYFYASGKMVIPLAAAVAVYALIRWRLEFFKRYFLGFALMGLAFGITFLPYGVTSAKDNWQGFMGRATETSIFSPQNQSGTFARYNLPYDPTWASKSAFENFRTNPAAWGSLIYQQSREVLDGVYRRGDQVPFYNVPGIVALAPFWAVLGILGLAYAAWKLWDARYAIPMLWFVVGMGATILTIDAPNYQRYTNAWPAMMLFPAALLDRIFAAGWPLSLSLARKWSAVPLVGVLLFLGVDSYREYFVFYPTTCPYCTSTMQARYAQALGQDYKGYQMGVGGYDVYFDYGSTRFYAKGVEGEDMVGAADNLPVLDNNGKGLAFLIYGNNADYLPLVRLFYPMGVVEEIKGVDGSTQFTSVKVTKEQVASTRVLHATYRPASGDPIERDEPGIGTSAKSPLLQGLAYPVQAEWKGGLVAPQYGLYTFALTPGPGDGVLELDGRSILQQNSGTGNGGSPSVEMVLAKGLHDIRLTGTLADAKSKLEVTWTAGGGATNPIPAQYLFNGTTGGLSGEIGPLVGSPDPMSAQDPFGGQPLMQRRSDPFVGFREASVVFKGGAYLARWQGKLNVPAEGDYGFGFGNNAPGVVVLDGQSAYGNGPGGAASGGPVHLTAGLHDIEARYASTGGSARIELFWTPPGAPPQIIPPTNLTPLRRSWTKEEAPEVPAASIPPPVIAEAPLKQPDLIFGNGDLSNPRGIAVDKAGNIYVGDRGNSRIVVYSPDGKVIRNWGKAATLPKEGEPAPPAQPGEFGEILDLGVADDGTLYVDDGLSHLQVFNAQGESKGAFGPEQVQISGPNGLAVGGKAADKNGSGIYIALTGQNRIIRIPSVDDLKNGKATLAGSVQSISPATFDQPVDVVVDPTGSGMIYAIDLKDRIMQLTPPADPSGPWTISKQWQVLVGKNDGGSRLAISPDGNKVYMSDPDRKRVDVVNVSTGEISYFGSEGSDPGKFGAPSGIAVGPDGRVLIVDSVNSRVQVFKPDAEK